jgi:hypothetical protein
VLRVIGAGAWALRDRLRVAAAAARRFSKRKAPAGAPRQPLARGVNKGGSAAHRGRAGIAAHERRARAQIQARLAARFRI